MEMVDVGIWGRGWRWGRCWAVYDFLKTWLAPIPAADHGIGWDLILVWEEPCLAYCCRASNRRGTRLWTFRILAWMLVGFIQTDFVSIGCRYLILSVRTYSSGACSRDTSSAYHDHLATRPFSPYSSFLSSSHSLLFSLVLYGTRFLQ